MRRDFISTHDQGVSYVLIASAQVLLKTLVMRRPHMRQNRATVLEDNERHHYTAARGP